MRYIVFKDTKRIGYSDEKDRPINGKTYRIIKETDDYIFLNTAISRWNKNALEIASYYIFDFNTYYNALDPISS